MKKRAAALWAIAVLALALVPSLAFATGKAQSPTLQVGGQAAGAWALGSQTGSENLPADFGNGGYKLFLDGDSSGWTQYYVDGATGTIDPDVKLYYEDGDGKVEVPADKYDLEWQRSWYDEEQEKTRYAEAQLPLGLVGSGEDDDHSGIGDTFEVVAVAKDGSGFTGRTEAAHVMPVDSKTFNYHAKYPYIEGAREAFVVPTWHNGFALATSAAADVRVKVRDDAVNSENGDIDASNYTVTYYKRKPGPYNTDEENYGSDAWVESDETRLDGFPTEAGTYFAVITGTGEYFGSTTIDFDIIDGYTFAEVWLDRSDGDGPLFSDGTASFVVNTGGTDGEEGVDWDIELRVGKFRTFVDSAMQFDEPLAEGEGYTYDATTHTITLDGAKAFEAFGDGGVVIRAYLVPRGQALTSENALAECFDGLGLREARVDYDFDDMQDCDLLPGWDRQIWRSYNVRVENASHPDGDDFDVEVTDVASSDDDIVQVTREFADDDETSDDYWWCLEALDCGEATLTATYRDPEELGGAQKTREFTVNVTHDVYGVDVQTESGSERALPGTSIKLVADGWHEADYDAEEGAEEPLGFAWSLDEESERYATIEPDEDDPAQATVTFRALTEEEAQEGDFWREIWVHVALNGQDDEGASVLRAENDCRLEMCSAYTELWPARIDSNLDMGASQDITAEVRSYPGTGEAEYDVVDNVSFHWEGLDDERVSVADGNGDGIAEGDVRAGAQAPFTITRLTDEWTDFRLVAEWGDGEREERRFELDGKRYGMWLDCDYDRVFSDGTLELRLQGDDDVDASKVEYTVGLWEGDGDEARWAKTFGAGCYTVSDDGWTIALDGGELLAQEGVDDFTRVRVLAQLKPGGMVAAENDQWIEVRVPWADYRHEWDNSMLPGWDHTVNGIGSVYVENGEHPDGEELEYRVTGVEIVRQSPEEDGLDVLSDLSEGDEGWSFKAANYGEAELKVSYDDLDGNGQSYEFKVYVGRDVYELSVESANGATRALPGETIELVASAEHFVEGGEGSLANMTYEWSLRDDGDNYAAIEADANDPSKAVVAFKGLPDGQEEIDQEVWAEVRLKEAPDPDNPDDTGERAYADIRLRVATDENEGDVDLSDCELRFVGDQYAAVADGEAWVFVSGANATFTPEFALYYQDRFIDPSCYTVAYEKAWYEGDEEKTQAIEGNELDAVSGDGSADCKYHIIITAKEGSGYNGALAGDGFDPYSIVVFDEYALNSTYADLYLADESARQFFINPMNGRYYLVPATNAKKAISSFTVRTGAMFANDDNHHEGTERVKDTDYEVRIHTAYKDAVEKNRTPATFAVLDETPLASVPTTAGAYVMVASGKGENGFHGDGGMLLDVQDSMDNVEIAAVGTQAYTGAEVKPALTVTYAGRTLVEGEDYQVEYADNVNVGTASATITGANPIQTNSHGRVDSLDEDRFFTGSKTVEFEIAYGWGAPVYIWADDNSTCTATRVRSDNADQQQTETASTTSVTTPATYTSAGKTVFTATFENAAFSTQTKTVEIAKLAKLNQSMNVAAKVKSVKAKKVKKKARTVAPLSVTGAQGAVSYKGVGTNAKSKKALKINPKTGMITVKKKTKKGKYKMKVTVTASGTFQYNPASKTVIVTVKVR